MADLRVDHEILIKNLQDMINSLEYDSMRSAGKAKMNAQVLLAMLQLKEHYESQVNKAAPKAAKK